MRRAAFTSSSSPRSTPVYTHPGWGPLSTASIHILSAQPQAEESGSTSNPDIAQLAVDAGALLASYLPRNAWLIVCNATTAAALVQQEGVVLVGAVWVCRRRGVHYY